jgi:hypothetical protein
MPGVQPKSRVSLLVRAALWIIVAALFLVRDIHQMHAAHLIGQQVTVWMAVQVALWVGVLLFWSYAGYRDWKRRARHANQTHSG